MQYYRKQFFYYVSFVFRAVYVNITKPSAARGVTLEFSGIESCE